MIDLIKRKWLYIIGYLYLLSSIYIFFLGNIKLFISIPICVIISLAFWKAIKNMPDIDMEVFKKKRVIVGIVIIILLWVIFAGVGGFIWQNTWDHKFRNAIFKDLVNETWPVIQGEVALCYYMGFWLPASIVGKILGLTAGYAFQVFWAFIGIVIAFAIMCQYLKKMKISNLILMIFFSGLDIVAFYIFSKLSIGEATTEILNGKHIELVLNGFNSSSNTTLLFWLYNQIVPFWVGMMLLLMQKNNKSIIYTYSLLLLYAPFPMVGLAPVIFYMVFKNYNENENTEIKIWKRWFIKIKEACTFENISALLIVIPIGLFYISNIAVNKIGILEIDQNRILRYIIYIFFEFIIYLVFIYRNNRKDMILNILFVISLITPFIQLGNRYDFAYRTCIPLAFYIMLLVIKELQNKDTKKLKRILLIIVICIGAVTPLTEMIRTVKMEKQVLMGEISARSDKLATVFTKKNNECYDNFIATTDSIFYRYLAKKNIT